MPPLLKPDMQAVVARTRLGEGPPAAMLPIDEACSNAVNAVISKFKEKTSEAGRIVLTVSGDKSSALRVTVEDNGIGLDKKNYRAFRTPFVGDTIKPRQKGFGRFVAFKVFEDITYFSKYLSESGEKYLSRSFKFDIYNSIEELILIPSQVAIEHQTGCTVTYAGLKSQFYAQLARFSDGPFIVSHLVNKFLPELLRERMPQTEVRVAGEVYSLQHAFAETFRQLHGRDLKLHVGRQDRDFRLDVLKCPIQRPLSHHTLMLFAADRQLGVGRPLTEKIGSESFCEDGEKYVLVAGLSGQFLDENANTPRTRLDVPQEELEEIESGVYRVIAELLPSQIDAIKGHQREIVSGLKKDTPILRFAFRDDTIDQYVNKSPNSWKEEDFVADLAKRRHELHEQWKSDFANATNDPEAFQKEKDRLLGLVTDMRRDALAEYVVQRKAVINFADGMRRLGPQTNIAKEEQFHDLIFPRRSDTASARNDGLRPLFNNNLWLLDERLSFFSYISSDLPPHGGSRQQGDRIADILLYEECYVGHNKNNSSMLIVELKRPGRNDYVLGAKGRDPIKQIYDLAERIREDGSLTTTDKRVVDVSSRIPINAILVADFTPSLKAILQKYGFNFAASDGYFVYNSSFEILVEVFSFERAIEGAKQRNAIFDEILIS